MKVANNLFIVTGGAGGIGKAVSSILTSKGALVALFDVLDSSKGTEVAKSIGDKAVYVQVDITESDSVKKVCHFAVTERSCIRFLIVVVVVSRACCWVPDLLNRGSRLLNSTLLSSWSLRGESCRDASTVPVSPSSRSGPTTWWIASPTLKRCSKSMYVNFSPK
jgi:NAD(P)-dependent dehydrogenase (short-subunit alcohol dehydrogenase family)